MGFGKGLVVGTILGAVGTITAALIADKVIENQKDDTSCEDNDEDEEEVDDE